MKRSKETFRKEILKKYQLEKGGDLSSYLFEPTPGLIKEACILLVHQRRNNDDINILRNFFKPKEEDIVSSIKKIDIDRFRPIVKFLKEGKTNPKLPSLELASWLVDFKPRPFIKYIQTNGKRENDKKIVNDVDQNSKEEKKNVLKIAIGCFILFLAGMVFYNLPTNVECMVWAKTHYKKVACENNVGVDVVPIDPVKFKNFKKIDVSLKTPFFDEDTEQPLVWYNKTKEGTIEYFTAPGLHPITKKTLNEITPYIIEKYVPKHTYKAESFVNE